jgi:hypothetical protein
MFRRPRFLDPLPGLSFPVLAASLVLLALPACQSGGGSSQPPIPYEELQGNLQRAYDNLEQGVRTGPVDQVPALCNALSAELDRLDEATKSMGFLEREKMKIQIATARNGLNDISRSAPAMGDGEVLQGNLKPISDSIHEMTDLLGKLAAASKSGP